MVVENSNNNSKMLVQNEMPGNIAQRLERRQEILANAKFAGKVAFFIGVGSLAAFYGAKKLLNAITPDFKDVEFSLKKGGRME